MTQAPTVHERRTSRDVAGGSSLAALAGLGAVVLTILGLVGLLPSMLAAIAAIAVGAGLVVEGAVFAARYSRMIGNAADPEVGTGMATQAVAGLGVAALGVLALLGVEAATLLAASVVVAGGALLLNAGAAYRLGSLERRGHGRREANYGASAAEGLVGGAAVVLGILALNAAAPLSLTLVGLLAAGGATAVSGSALGYRSFETFTSNA